MNQIYRLYIGIAIGIVITFVIPVDRIEGLLRPIVNIIINVGRYLFVPTMFFGIIAGFAHSATEREMRQTKGRKTVKSFAKGRNRSMYIYAALILLLTTTLLVVIGGGTILLAPLSRLSIIFQEFEAVAPLNTEQIFTLTFPQNLFSVFAQPGNFILPIAIVALIFGWAMKSRLENNSIVPAISIEIESIFNFLLNAYINFLGIGMILISAYLVVQMRSITDIGLFYQFIAVVSILTAVVIIIVYPLVAIILRCRTRPMRLIKHILSSTVVSVVSGDSYFSSIMVLRLFRDRFPADRDIPYNLTLLGMLFSKAGSAFVASMVFFMVLQSYTAIGITFLNTVWIMVIIIALSPLAATSPRLGVVHLVVAAAALYGNGLENGFLIIVPILPFLISIATLLDIFTVTFFGYLLADKLGFSTIADEDVGESRDRRKRS